MEMESDSCSKHEWIYLFLLLLLRVAEGEFLEATNPMGISLLHYFPRNKIYDSAATDLVLAFRELRDLVL